MLGELEDLTVSGHMTHKVKVVDLLKEVMHGGSVIVFTWL